MFTTIAILLLYISVYFKREHFRNIDAKKFIIKKKDDSLLTVIENIQKYKVIRDPNNPIQKFKMHQFLPRSKIIINRKKC